MPRLTKTQQKRLVKEIQAKAVKLYMHNRTVQGWGTNMMPVLNSKDMEAIDKLCAKWLKRIG